MEKKLSNKIYYLYIFLAFLVVIIHSKLIFMLDEEAAFYSISFNVQKSFVVFSDCAVPLFFCLSAFLLFRQYKIEHYFTTIKKRLFSLVIPYFIWSAIGFIFFSIIFKLILKQPLSFSFPDILKDILFATKNTPIWFARSLFVLSLASPIFYLIYKYCKHFSLLFFIGFVCLNFFLKFSYSGVVFWLPVFFIGGYFGFFQIDINCFCKKIRFSVASLLIFFVCIFFLVFFAVEESTWIYYLYRVFSIVLMWCSFDVFSKIYERDAGDWIKVSSFVFFSHIIVVTLVRGLFFKLFDENNITALLGFFIISMISFFFLLAFANLIKKICNPLYKVLSGGR